MSKIYVDAVEPEGASTVLTLGSATDTIQIPGGGAGASKVLTSDATGGATWAAAPSGLFSAYALLEDQKGAGNNGQALSITVWNHRDLNTKVYDGIGITIASNRFELPIGTYLIKWSAPAFRANRHQTRLYDDTNSSVVAGGSSEYSIEMYRGDQTRSFGAARVVCSAATNYQIDHYVYSAGGGGEYGTMTCTYTQVEVYKES